MEETWLQENEHSSQDNIVVQGLTAECGRGMGLEQNSQLLGLQKINYTSPPRNGASITPNLRFISIVVCSDREY